MYFWNSELAYYSLLTNAEKTGLFSKLVLNLVHLLKFSCKYVTLRINILN